MSMALSRKSFLGAAVLIAALALVAKAVTGREQPQASNAGPATGVKAEAAPSANADELDLAKLMRTRTRATAPDLFARPPVTAPMAPTPAPVPPAAPAAPAEPPPPPALPFRYLGQMERQKQPTVLLLKGEDVIIATAGDTVDDLYKVESITELTIEFTYLPRAARQSLAIPPL